MSAAQVRRRVARWAAAGAIAMAAVAIGDAGWAAWYGEALPRQAAGAAIALEVALLVVPGLVVGALLGAAVRPVVRVIVALGPRISASVAALGIAGAVAFVLLRDHEIDWDTVDVRLLLVPLGLLAFAGALRLGAQARWILAGGLSLAAVSTWAANPGAQLVAIDCLASGSRVGAALLQGIGRASDGDRDGTATWLCGDVCDCDDGDDTVSPSAEEIAGDGIDQDCDGEDLSAIESEVIASMFAQPQPTAQPIGDAALPKPRWRPDILIITIDTLRADHLGIYGYARDTSPRIDAWAKKDAVVFAQARSGGPSTRFSIPSMMVGRHFTELARNKNEWPTIANRELFFAERLAELGYASAAFHSVRYFRPFFGINQGWEHWSCACLDVRGPPLDMSCADFIADETLAWLDEHGKSEERPLLMWSYIGDPHSRYMHHEGTPEFGEKYKDVYDHEIRFADEHVGRLLDGVASRRPGRDLVILLHADHGEGLDAYLDHGSLYHSANLYDELVHVPLIVSGPGFPHTVDESVSLVDFVPTMLELMGEPIDPALRGTSLVPWLYDRATAPHPPVMFEKHRALDDAMHGMVAWPYKVIKTMPSGRIDIFDLAADPGERHDLTGKLDKALRKRLTGALSYWHREMREPFDDSRRISRRLSPCPCPCPCPCPMQREFAPPRNADHYRKVMRRSAAMLGLWLVACHTDTSSNPQVATTPPSALPPVTHTPTPPPKRLELPRHRPVSSPEIREAHARAQEIALGSASALPLQLAPADADTHGRFTPLFEPEGATPMKAFHAALAELGAGKDADGKVRVLVYGASGTAADRWTGYLRAYLQARFGDGGPGFVPLGKATKWSRHQEYSLDSSKQWIKHSRGKSASEGGHYGLLGAALAARKKGASCAIEPARGSSSSRAVASFELWYLQQPGGGTATVTLDGKSAATLDTRGEQVGAGYLKLPCAAGAHTLGLRTLDDGEVRTFGVVAESAAPGVVVDTLGIVGQHASWMLDWNAALWAEHMVRRDPALVVFAFGTNEAFDKRFDEGRFVAQYGEVLGRIRKTLPAASCVLMAPGDQGKPGDELSPLHDANLAIVRRVEREMAATHGCALWDAQAFMNNPGGMDAWVHADPPLAKDDYVHTTGRGAAMIAMAVADAILWSYDAERVAVPASATGVARGPAD